MSNFDFLKEDFSGLYRKMQKAEHRVYNEPDSSAHYGRLVLEECVNRIFEAEYIDRPYKYLETDFENEIGYIL